MPAHSFYVPQPDLVYNVALCHYANKGYGAALRLLNDIITRASREHPELSIGLEGRSEDVRPVPHGSAALRDSSVIEALNLRAAIQYELKDEAAAR